MAPNAEQEAADRKPEDKRLGKKAYERALRELQVKLIRMQNDISVSGARVLAVFEGRDAAGKGGAIKRITQPLSPRCRAQQAHGTGTESVVLPTLHRASANSRGNGTV